MQLKMQRKAFKDRINYIHEKFGVRPVFFYNSPIKYIDDDTPDYMQLTQKSLKSKQSIKKLVLQEQFQPSQQSFTQNQQIRRIKFDKSQFVKIKKTNYKLFYKIITSCIGKGSFGTVGKVQSILTGEYRAAKILKINNMKQTDMEKLMDQVNIMVELDHHNIANLLEVYQYKKQFILICELCQGGDLLKFVNSSNRVNREQIVGKIIKQVLHALIYLHSKGLVHRDIKPQNILFQNQKSYNIKLIDFGIATKISPNKQLSSRVGTPAYIAPQIILQKYTQKIDIWSVGITMYQLLSGRIPFNGNNIKQLMQNILKQNIQFKDQCWDEISPECMEVIKLMTVKDYNIRSSAKQMFQHPYFTSIEDMEVSNDEKELFADNLRKFQFKNKLQAAIQTFIASQLLSNDQKTQIVNFFKQFDSNNDGVISAIEMKTALQRRKTISSQRIQALMQVMDTNGSGMIDYTQFLAAGFVDARQLTIKRLKQAFSHVDLNGNGKISLSQIRQFMKQLCQTQQEIEDLFEQFDVNGDGSITEEEFAQLMIERSKNISMTRYQPRGGQMQRRIDTASLDIVCIQFVLAGGPGSNFLENLIRNKHELEKQDNY